MKLFDNQKKNNGFKVKSYKQLELRKLNILLQI